MGHGTATRPTDPAAYDRLEDDLLERFPDEPVDAIGFSLGARTLLTIASGHPERDGEGQSDDAGQHHRRTDLHRPLVADPSAQP